MTKLTDYYGPARKCIMCLPAVNIHHVFCQTCFNRGYVAMCLNCDGKGKTTVPVGGSVGTMDSTCNFCGGRGTFAVSKEYWETHHEEEVLVPERGDKELAPPASEGQRLLQPVDIVGA